MPIIERYERRGMVRRVSGVPPPEQVRGCTWLNTLRMTILTLEAMFEPAYALCRHLVSVCKCMKIPAHAMYTVMSLDDPPYLYMHVCCVVWLALF